MAKSDDSTGASAAAYPPPDGAAIAALFRTVDTASLRDLVAVADDAIGAAGLHVDGGPSPIPAAGLVNALWIAETAIGRMLDLLGRPRDRTTPWLAGRPD
jgi:hypothetical protein